MEDPANNCLPDNINPNNFPAKLWRLVNRNGAVRWDSRGQAIVIDQQLFETQVLSPGSGTSSATELFKTTNFSSFVRQLNLYGFKKVDPPADHRDPADNRLCHHFHNPNFQRSCPQLLENLVRLTVDNKAKLKSGQYVSSRLPNQYQRLGLNVASKLRAGCSLPQQQPPAHPYYAGSTQAMRPHSRTLVPPTYLHRVPAAAFPPNLPLVKEGQMPSSHHCTGVAPKSKALQVQPAFLLHPNIGNTRVSNFSPQNPQHQPGYYPTVCHCFHPVLVAGEVAGLQTGLFSPRSYYQIADEVMRTSRGACLVKVETTEKPVSVPKPSSDPSDAISCDNNGSAPVVAYKKEEELVVSVPEQIAEDAIYKVLFDLDNEIINFVASNSGEDSSRD